MQRKARDRREPVEKAAVPDEIVISVTLNDAREAGHRLVNGSSRAVHRLPFGAPSVISPRFIARLIKGCRVDACAGHLVSK